MAHARQQIREAIATILSRNPINWRLVTETRVKAQRQHWPYLMVYSESDQSEPTTVDNPTVYGRDLTIAVVGLFLLPGNGDTYTVEDRMDALSAEVETKLTQTTLRDSVPRVQAMSLISTVMEVVQMDDDFQGYAQVALTWSVRYATLEGNPNTFH